MRRITAIATGGLAAALVLAPVTAWATRPAPDHKVTICHRTNSDSNPWVSITVDYAAVDGDGHSDHMHHVADEQHDRGDIIPPVDGVTAGLNWDDAGRAILENDCEVPDVVPTPTPTPTAPPTVPPTTPPTNIPPTLTPTPTTVGPAVPDVASGAALARQAAEFATINPVEQTAAEGQLPHTGLSTSLYGALAAMLLTLGMGVKFVARRYDGQQG